MLRLSSLERFPRQKINLKQEIFALIKKVGEVYDI